jgi:hypothetical protein
LQGVVSDEEFLFAPKEFVVKGLCEEEGRGEVDDGCDVQVEVMIEGFVRHGDARDSIHKIIQQADLSHYPWRFRTKKGRRGLTVCNRPALTNCVNSFKSLVKCLSSWLPPALRLSS